MSTSLYMHLDPADELTDSAVPLTDERSSDGKSLINPPRRDGLSPWYQSTHTPFTPADSEGRTNDFDFHVYYDGQEQIEHARKLHDRIRREFPEVRMYKFFETPIGPHPVPMFECNTFNPWQTGALMSFLVAYRGPLSVLIHPNTGDDLRDHTERATWMGPPYELKIDIFKRSN